MFTIKNKGDFKKTNRFLKKTRRISEDLDADYIGQKFVTALAKATPVDSGLTAESWAYEVKHLDKNYVQIIIKNTNIQNGVNVALLVNYGHVAPNGTWVEGADYLYPTLRKLYIDVVNETWKEIEKV